MMVYCKQAILPKVNQCGFFCSSHSSAIVVIAAGVREGMPIVKLVDSFIGKFDVIANEGSVITVFVR